MFYCLILITKTIFFYTLVNIVLLSYPWLEFPLNEETTWRSLFLKALSFFKDIYIGKLYYHLVSQDAGVYIYRCELRWKFRYTCFWKLVNH
jgi:hypothetical protein